VDSSVRSSCATLTDGSLHLKKEGIMHGGAASTLTVAAYAKTVLLKLEV